jgi:hypothetical protein
MRVARFASRVHYLIVSMRLVARELVSLTVSRCGAQAGQPGGRICCILIVYNGRKLRGYGLVGDVCGARLW